MRMLLNVFDLKERLELIEKSNLVYCSIAFADEGEELECTKCIFSSIGDLPKEQLRILTDKFDDFTLLDIAKKMKAPQFGVWVQNKIQTLQN
eukprot:UN02929